MEDVVISYYSNLKTPVFLYKNKNIVWHNNSAASLSEDKNFIHIILNLNFTDEESSTLISHGRKRYKVLIRPFEDFFCIELLEQENALQSLMEYYQKLKTPVFLCMKKKVLWYNNAAAVLFESKKYRQCIVQLPAPTEEMKESFICNDFYYKVFMRPFEDFFFVEVLEKAAVGFNVKKELYSMPNELLACEVIDNIARIAVHDMSQAVTQISNILEKNNNFAGLKFVDIIVKRMYSFIRATNLCYEYNILLQNNINPEIVDIFVEIDALCSSISSLMRKSGVSFKWHVPDGEVFCDIDMHKLGFALFHIICNAFRFTSGSSNNNEITVNVELDGSNNIKIDVCDNGIGIPEDIKDKILKPFFSFDRFSGDIAGVGLGLTYSSLLADKMGGSFKIDSAKGGTKVSLLIPVVPLSDVMGLSSHIINYGDGKYDNMVATLLGSIEYQNLTY